MNLCQMVTTLAAFIVVSEDCKTRLRKAGIYRNELLEAESLLAFIYNTSMTMLIFIS